MYYYFKLKQIKLKRDVWVNKKERLVKNWRKRHLKQTSEKWNKDAVYLLTLILTIIC